MIDVRADEVRACLRDADLAALHQDARDGGFAAWKRMAEHLAASWYGDVAERVGEATDEIAGIAARRWRPALEAMMDRERHRLEGYAALREAVSDDWHRRFEAFRRPSVQPQRSERHVMDGSLPSAVLATALVEALSGEPVSASAEARIAGAPGDVARARAVRTAIRQPDGRRADAMLLGASFFGTRPAGATDDRNRPKPKGLGRLAVALGSSRLSTVARAHALGLPVDAASKAGASLSGRRHVPAPLEVEPAADGLLILVSRRFLVRLPSEALSRVAWLVPQAAARRLHELAADDASLTVLAEALSTHPNGRPVAAILQAPFPVASAHLQHGSRVYEAAPPGPVPDFSGLRDAGRRAFQAIALADADGSHVGYGALDPLSRTFHGQSRRAAYGLDGALLGRLQHDDGGWRFFEGPPAGGFVSVPETLSA